MAFSDAQKFVSLGMPFPLAAVVGDAIADATSANPNVTALVALTDNSGGTPSNTIPDTPTSYTEATIANQVASLATKTNQIITALKA